MTNRIYGLQLEGEEKPFNVNDLYVSLEVAEYFGKEKTESNQFSVSELVLDGVEYKEEYRYIFSRSNGDAPWLMHRVSS